MDTPNANGPVAAAPTLKQTIETPTPHLLAWRTSDGMIRYAVASHRALADHLAEQILSLAKTPFVIVPIDVATQQQIQSVANAALQNGNPVEQNPSPVNVFGV